MFVLVGHPEKCVLAGVVEPRVSLGTAFLRDEVSDLVLGIEAIVLDEVAAGRWREVLVGQHTVALCSGHTKGVRLVAASVAMELPSFGLRWKSGIRIDRRLYLTHRCYLGQTVL
jgi:hypothetical protein